MTLTTPTPTPTPTQGTNMEIGTRVITEDDEGVIVDILDEKIGQCDVIVAWKSGVRTPAYSGDLERK